MLILVPGAFSQLNSFLTPQQRSSLELCWAEGNPKARPDVTAINEQMTSVGSNHLVWVVQNKWPVEIA